MSSVNEDAGEGRQDGLSEVVGGSAKAILQIAGHLAHYATGLGEKLTPEADVHIALRDPERRRELLEQVIREVTPDGVNEELWVRWLQGGASPYDIRVKKAGPGQEKPVQTLERSTKRVRAEEAKVAKARRALDTAEREVAEAERDLRAVQNLDSAAVHWFVVQQLVTLMSPLFAMGPAWTLMRSMSAHLSEQEADELTMFDMGDAKIAAIADLQEKRRAETSMMLEVLDLGSGVPAFEKELRSALLTVCRQFDVQRNKLAPDGRRPRSKDRLSSEIHPKARNDSDAILDGLAKAS